MKTKYQETAKEKRAQLQALRADFETLEMKTGETVSDYFWRTMSIANKMRTHGERLNDVNIIEKIQRSMTSKFNYVVCSIEESKDIDNLSIDEMQSSLPILEQKMNRQDKHEKEEQALQASSSNKFSTSRGWGRGRGRGRGSNNNGGGRHSNQRSEENSSNSQGRGKGNDNSHSTKFKPKSVDNQKLNATDTIGMSIISQNVVVKILESNPIFQKMTKKFLCYWHT